MADREIINTKRDTKFFVKQRFMRRRSSRRGECRPSAIARDLEHQFSRADRMGLTRFLDARAFQPNYSAVKLA